MPAAFPLTPVPAYYATASFATDPWGVYYVGGNAPTITLSQATPDSYKVLNYQGVQVSSGFVTGTTCTPTAPGGGWKPGWYRVYFTGGSTDIQFGVSYGVAMFCVLRNNPNFISILGTGAGAGTYPNVNDPPAIPVKSAVLSLQSRLQISNAAAPETGSDQLTAQTLVNATAFKNWWTTNGYTDPARPRPLFVQFPNGSVSGVNLAATSGIWLTCYPATGTLSASGNLWASLAPGSVSGAKVTVYYPNNTTVVETWDNLASAAAAVTAINASSAYLHVNVPGTGGGGTPSTQTATNFSNARWNGVVSVVSTLYPTVQYFEGPRNEPDLVHSGVEFAWQMKLFQAAVHAGNASAKAIGPCNVTIATGTAGWESFLAAGGGNYCDEIAFHSYNAMNGDLNLGRSTFTKFTALLKSYGLDSLPLWQTEGGTSASVPVYGVYHPRRARWALIAALLLEQFGIPREKNIQWYDYSHGFWAVPLWIVNTNSAITSSLNPPAALFRMLAEETFGMTHSLALDFGTPGNNMFLGSVYSPPGGGASCAVIVAASAMPTCSVTLLVTGTAGPLTVVDAFGNLSSVTVTGGIATVACAEVPTYVRLPVGVNVSVVSINDWQPAQRNHAPTATATLGGVAQPLLNDEGFMTVYAAGTTSTGVAWSTAGLPDTAVLTWANPVTVDRVVAFCGSCWQQLAAFTDFDVQTTVNGSTWVTQKSVTTTSNVSFQHGSNSSDVGCKQETFWDEQWIFDVGFAAPVSVVGVRLNVRATSYGGEPDAAAGTAGSQGGLQRIVLQELMALEGAQIVNVHKPQPVKTVVIT